MDSPLRTVCVHTAGVGAVLAAATVFGRRGLRARGLRRAPVRGRDGLLLRFGGPALRGPGLGVRPGGGDEEDGDEDSGDAEAAAHGSNSA